MALFELLILLMVAALPLMAAAHRFGLPYPMLLVAAGAAFVALPFAPRVDIGPKLALVLFVAPALLQSAYEASPRELWQHRVSLFMLAIMAVVATTAAVASSGHLAACPWPPLWPCARSTRRPRRPHPEPSWKRWGCPGKGSCCWKARAFSTTPPRCSSTASP